MITRKAGPGWAAGCTGVIRPACRRRSRRWRIAVLAERAGMPAGVCNVITGPSGEMGGELTSNPMVRKLSFTGSTEVGAQAARAVRRRRSRRPAWSWAATRRSSCSTTPISTPAVLGAMASKYRNTGQTCVCANRILVQDGVYDAFAAKLKAAVEATEGRQRHGARRHPGPADQRRCRRQGRGAHRRRADAAARPIVTGGKRHALRRQFLRADGAGQRAARRA